MAAGPEAPHFLRGVTSVVGLCPGWLSGWGRRDCPWVSGKAVGRPRPGTGLRVALGTPAPTPPPRGLRRESGWQPARSRSPRACGEQPRPARGRAGGWVPGQRRVPAQGSGGARPLALRRLCSWRRHRDVAQGVRAPRFCSPGFRRPRSPTFPTSLPAAAPPGAWRPFSGWVAWRPFSGWALARPRPSGAPATPSPALPTASLRLPGLLSRSPRFLQKDAGHCCTALCSDLRQPAVYPEGRPSLSPSSQGSSTAAGV